MNEYDGAVGLGVPAAAVREAVARALAEDLPWGDITSELLVAAELRATALMVARAGGVIAGLSVAAEVFRSVGPELKLELLVPDGARVEPGRELLRVRGTARAILSAERVALNFVQRLSGTATLAARFAEAVRETGARIVDTRKTTPGLRVLEKYAVRCGGGQNHRFHLGDAVLVKDNHRAALASAGVGLALVVKDARRRLPHTVTVEVEVDTPAELEEALAAEPDAILLDNMTPAQLAAAVRRIRELRPETKVEASGGVTLESVRAIAETGVDLISVGALTHSAPALDVSLDFRMDGEEL